MKAKEAIARLNGLALRSVSGQEPLRTTEDVRAFLRNPPKHDLVPVDELIAPIIDAFRAADGVDRQKIVLKLGEGAQRALRSYAANMAVLAVRRNSADLVDLGLFALAVEGGRPDIRDSIVVLAKLYHSAVRLGMNAPRTFSDVASLVTADRLRYEMEQFPSRPTEVRDLAAFFLREDLTADGFDYVQDVP